MRRARAPRLLGSIPAARAASFTQPATWAEVSGGQSCESARSTSPTDGTRKKMVAPRRCAGIGAPSSSHASASASYVHSGSAPPRLRLRRVLGGVGPRHDARRLELRCCEPIEDAARQRPAGVDLVAGVAHASVGTAAKDVV
eukprot:1415929-Prymnesium_polylepis.1